MEETIEGQIRWLDTTNNAKTDEYRKRRMQMEAIVTRLVSATQGQSFNQTRAEYNRHQGQI